MHHPKTPASNHYPNSCTEKFGYKTESHNAHCSVPSFIHKMEKKKEEEEDTTGAKKRGANTADLDALRKKTKKKSSNKKKAPATPKQSDIAMSSYQSLGSNTFSLTAEHEHKVHHLLYQHTIFGETPNLKAWIPDIVASTQQMLIQLHGMKYEGTEEAFLTACICLIAKLLVETSTESVDFLSNYDFVRHYASESTPHYWKHKQYHGDSFLKVVGSLEQSILFQMKGCLQRFSRPLGKETTQQL